MAQGSERAASPIVALATFYRRGGLTIITTSAGPPVLRTVVQPDGDVVTFTTPGLTKELADQHVAALDAQMAALHTARTRVVTALTSTLAGGGLLVGGLALPDEVGTWLTWVGGGACGASVGGGLIAAWRIGRWLKRQGAFGPPRFRAAG